ncbi:unnamed protein product [Symbiodinium natans]|uniref:Uncharacterized protein n=1 Tax=Symbiodinium natans TaxID=878477 RepID=A0A812QW44_9DINO|nr:unnamed protein product [Symbiodinium natans]
MATHVDYFMTSTAGSSDAWFPLLRPYLIGGSSCPVALHIYDVDNSYSKQALQSPGHGHLPWIFATRKTVEESLFGAEMTWPFSVHVLPEASTDAATCVLVHATSSTCLTYRSHSSCQVASLL